MSQEVDVLITIRKIIRATDLYSRQLSKKSGLTAPQLLVLQAIQEMGAVAISFIHPCQSQPGNRDQHSGSFGGPGISFATPKHDG